VTREGAGAVQSDSLAAESQSAGGGFGSNRGGEAQSAEAIGAATHKAHAARDEARDPASGLRREDVESYGGEAPSYASIGAVRKAQQGAPHGKNLTEGGFEGEGPGDSILAEPGSRKDPAREAERRFGLSGSGEEEEEGKKKGRDQEGSRGAGMEGSAGGLEGQNVFDKLGGDADA
jgi:hypothetical protein